MFHMVKNLSTMTCKYQNINCARKLQALQVSNTREAVVFMQAIRCLNTTNATLRKRTENQQQQKMIDERLQKRKSLSKNRKLPVIEVSKVMTVYQLAEAANVKPDLIIEAADILGKTIYISTALHEFDLICGIVRQLGLRWKLEDENKSLEKTLLSDKDEYKSSKPRDMSGLSLRPPIITIMGHVDHGKTTLLDYLRKTSVAEKEAGGITQKIGAFSVKVNEDKRVTFLDTPGHAAFTAMRQRGAQLTDIVVLVVAADDGIMEQTEESIRMARQSQVPIVVAINKCDSKNAKPEEVMKQLRQFNLEPESDGGSTQVIPISAKTGKGISDLVESILLEAELMNMRADVSARVEGVVIESQQNEAQGPVGSIVVQQGTLKKGMWLTAGTAYGRVRFLTDENNKPLVEAPPGTPVNIVGWKSLPPVGEIVLQVKTESRAKEVSKYRTKLKNMEQLDKDWKNIYQTRQKEKEIYTEMKKECLRAKESRELLGEKSKKLFTTTSDVPELNIVVKADVDGSLDAIVDVLKTYDCGHLCELNIIDSGVGPVTEGDINSAHTFSGSIIVFNQSITEATLRSALKVSVPIQRFDVIYHFVDHLKVTMQELIDQQDNKVLGEAEVKDTFLYKTKQAKIKVAGCLIESGQFDADGSFALIRNGKTIHEGELASLKKKSLSVNLVKAGEECGVAFVGASVEPQAGDVIHQLEYYKKPLTWSPPGF